MYDENSITQRFINKIFYLMKRMTTMSEFDRIMNGANERERFQTTPSSPQHHTKINSVYMRRHHSKRNS